MVSIAALMMVALTSPASGARQFHPYVCQTPAFWCAFQYPQAGIPNGTSCFCTTAWGPVAGYSIDPSGVPNAPPLPTPQPQPPGGGRPPGGSGRGGDVTADDCYKGLGNCPGSFRNAAAGSGRGAGSVETSTRSNRGSTSAFGSALQELIDAAEDDFDAVQGEYRRTAGSSDTYAVSVLPAGMERCVLFVPRSSSRRRWVSCFASDSTSASRLVSQVAAALGSEGSRDADQQTWRVGRVEVAVDRDDPVGLTIRLAR